MLQTETQFKESLKIFLVREGFTVLGDMSSSPGDLLIAKDGRVTIIEIKVKSCGWLDLTHALGQLVVARSKFGFRDSWLVIDSVPSLRSRQIIKLFEQFGIDVFCFKDDKFERITSESLLKPVRKTRKA